MGGAVFPVRSRLRAYKARLPVVGKRQEWLMRESHSTYTGLFNVKYQLEKTREPFTREAVLQLPKDPLRPVCNLACHGYSGGRGSLRTPLRGDFYHLCAPPLATASLQ